LRNQIDAVQGLRRGEVQLLRLRVGADALDVRRLLDLAGGAFDALDEGVFVVHVKDQDAGPAELPKVADARRDDVEVTLYLGGVTGSGGEQHDEDGQQRAHGEFLVGPWAVALYESAKESGLTVEQTGVLMKESFLSHAPFWCAPQ